MPMNVLKKSREIFCVEKEIERMKKSLKNVDRTSKYRKK